MFEIPEFPLLSLKGQCYEIFDLWIFHSMASCGPLKGALERFAFIFEEFSWSYSLQNLEKITHKSPSCKKLILSALWHEKGFNVWEI